MEQSRKEFMLAAAAFRALVADVPSGIPGDDGVFRLRQAGDAFRSALHVYVSAMRDFDEFIKNGRLPTPGDPSTHD
jgi:hypothetical protein